LKRLRWTERASSDIVEILRYYQMIDPTLAIDLRRQITAAPKILLDRPGIGSPIGKHGMRKWRVRRTPFLLFYRNLPNGIVEIAHVRHAAQDWRPE